MPSFLLRHDIHPQCAGGGLPGTENHGRSIAGGGSPSLPQARHGKTTRTEDFRVCARQSSHKSRRTEHRRAVCSSATRHGWPCPAREPRPVGCRLGGGRACLQTRRTGQWRSGLTGSPSGSPSTLWGQLGPGTKLSEAEAPKGTPPSHQEHRALSTGKQTLALLLARSQVVAAQELGGRPPMPERHARERPS